MRPDRSDLDALHACSKIRPGTEEAPHETPRGHSFQCFVAGWRFYEGDATLLELHPGVPVSLERELANRHDPNAVVVLSQSARKLGYIPTYFSELTATALAVGRSVQGRIVEVNPPPSPTNERLRILVEVSIA